MNDKLTTGQKARPQFRATDVTNLSLDTKTGIYYLLAKVCGKGYRESLKTTSKTDARTLLNKRLAEIRSLAESGINIKSDLTVAQCAELFAEQQRTLAAAGERSAEYVESNILYAIRKIWKIFPESFGGTAIRKVTLDDLKTGHNKVFKVDSASHSNTIKRVLCGIFEIAIEKKVLTENIAEKLPNKSRTTAKKIIPTDAEIVKLLAHITRKESCNSHKDDVKDLIEFFCWTGCRQDEAKHVEVRDVNFETNLLHVRICKGSGGDESRARYVPIVAPEIRALLEKLIADKKPNDPLLNVWECLETLEVSCAALGLPKYTHHTFRHVFATRALEATGCDFFTVANWLGHTDGGKLLAVTYAHLNQEHSQKQAAKLKFNFGQPKPTAAPALGTKQAAQTVNIQGKEYTLQELAALVIAKQTGFVPKVLDKAA